MTAQFVCDFGIRHGVNELCGCQKNFGFYPFEFRNKIRELYLQPGHPLYSTDITETMRRNAIDRLREGMVKSENTVVPI